MLWLNLNIGRHSVTPKLTAKQMRFCEEYLIDFNATQAAIRAGYSKKTAKEIGCENLTKPNIAGYLAELRGELKERTLVTVIANLSKPVKTC